MQAHQIYSPLDPSEYVIPTLDRCEVRAIIGLPEPVRTATWNLFWLSNPTLDAMPLLGVQWVKHYHPIVKEIGGRQVTLVGKIIEDVYSDITLQRKLMMHPRRFADWWVDEDITIYDTYQVLGEPWRHTALARAVMAAEIREAGAVKIQRGNVIYPTFPKRA